MCFSFKGGLARFNLHARVDSTNFIEATHNLVVVLANETEKIYHQEKLNTDRFRWRFLFFSYLEEWWLIWVWTWQNSNWKKPFLFFSLGTQKTQRMGMEKGGEAHTRKLVKNWKIRNGNEKRWKIENFYVFVWLFFAPPDLNNAHFSRYSKHYCDYCEFFL